MPFFMVFPPTENFFVRLCPCQSPGKQGHQLCCVFPQVSKGRFHQSKLVLEHPKRMLLFCPYVRFALYAGKQKAFEIEVIHDRDVNLSPSQAGLVNADNLHLRHGVQRSRQAHIVRNAPPQLFVRAPEQRCSLAHRQLLPERQGKGFKQRRKATAFARPGDISLAGLAAVLQTNRGTSSCIQFSNWKKSRRLHSRLSRSCTP